MKRRAFIAGLGSAAAWPVVARGQQPKKAPLLGVLWPNPPSRFEIIRQGLMDLGYVEGKNIRFEFRWAEGALDQLPEMAQDLVRVPVDLIITLGRQPHWQQNVPHEQFLSSLLLWAIHWQVAWWLVSRDQAEISPVPPE